MKTNPKYISLVVFAALPTPEMSDGRMKVQMYRRMSSNTIVALMSAHS